MSEFPDTTLVVLTGGRGRRLGRGEKAFVEVGGRALVLRVLDHVPRFAGVLLVGEATPGLRALGLPLAADLIPQAGAPGGVATGLALCKTPWAFVVACDMPLINPRVLAALWSVRGAHDAVVPEVDGRVHPLHAFYRAAAVAPVARALAERGGSLHALLAAVDTRAEPIDDPWSVANVNTPEELEAVEAFLR